MLTITTIIDCAARLGESAHWHAASGRFLWIDLLDPALFSCDAQGQGLVRRPLPLPGPLGALVATPDPDHVLISCRAGLYRLSLSSLATEFVQNPEAGREAIAFNDMKVDRGGRLWIGTSDLAETDPRGAIWCHRADGPTELCDAGFAVSNGPAFSPEGQVMYFVDSMNRRVLAYDLAPVSPRLRNRRSHLSFGPDMDPDMGLPDGITVDASGDIWLAHWAGARISRWTPDGQFRDSFALPADNITSLAFGGADMQTLLVTSASAYVAEDRLAQMPHSGATFLLSTQTTGLAETLFGAGAA